MAQYKLSGTIKDSDNKEPLKNASIYFTDLKKIPLQTKTEVIFSKI
jgi:hypothetical protein